MWSTLDTDIGFICLGFASQVNYSFAQEVGSSLASLSCMSASECTRKDTETRSYVRTWHVQTLVENSGDVRICRRGRYLQGRIVLSEK